MSLLEMIEHLFGGELRPIAPAHLFRDLGLVRGPLAFCLPFGGILAVIQAFEEEQIRKLLNGIERVGKSARPEFVPEGVDLRAEFGVG
jgi:hypothetical protein